MAKFSRFTIWTTETEINLCDILRITRSLRKADFVTIYISFWCWYSSNHRLFERYDLFEVKIGTKFEFEENVRKIEGNNLLHFHWESKSIEEATLPAVCWHFDPKFTETENLGKKLIR